jgi:hypothetical protein
MVECCKFGFAHIAVPGGVEMRGVPMEISGAGPWIWGGAENTDGLAGLANAGGLPSSAALFPEQPACTSRFLSLFRFLISALSGREIFPAAVIRAIRSFSQSFCQKIRSVLPVVSMMGMQRRISSNVCSSCPVDRFILSMLFFTILVSLKEIVQQILLSKVRIVIGSQGNCQPDCSRDFLNGRPGRGIGGGAK